MTILNTALGGTLLRTETGWQWSDGTPASNVYDMRPSWYYNFRVRNYADASYIEVPTRLASEEFDLQWITEFPYQVDFDGDHEAVYKDEVVPDSSWLDINWRDPIIRLTRKGPRVYLVPAETWDAWNNSEQGIIGARWDKKDEEFILARARSLGWNG